MDPKERHISDCSSIVQFLRNVDILFFIDYMEVQSLKQPTKKSFRIFSSSYYILIMWNLVGIDLNPFINIVWGSIIEP